MRILSVLFLVLIFSFGAIAQEITSIYDIQFTEDSSGDSPLIDSVVTIEGNITGEQWAFGSTYWIQDDQAAWSGILVYDPDRGNAQGDSVRITAKVSEYYGMTQLSGVTAYELLGTGNMMEPVVVTTGEIATGGSMAEAYEAVLVKVVDAAIADPDLGYGEWSLDDGSGPCRVDDVADHYFNPSNYDSVEYLIGLLNYSFNDTKIEPRLANDVKQGGKYTRLQYIQQVRVSDLLKAPEDEYTDFSYMANRENAGNSYAGDTVTVKGIVTMPTGLSFAGDGIKFILSEPDGGPWSAILSYHPDSTFYPSLFEGDLIEMTGYIGEYRTAPSNMTELWLISSINIIDFGLDLPPTPEVTTGDLRLPVTAEQWGNVFVHTNNAEIIDYGGDFEIYGIDDGTGYALIDDDSDSIQVYYNDHPYSALGTIIDSARGWIYHHYGSYFDSSVYKLEPNYISDLTFGAGPPLLSNVTRDVGVPTTETDVTVSLTIQTNLEISEAALYYDVSNSGYNKADLTNTEGTTYEGTIPAQPIGSFVSYFIVATDNQAQSTILPADTSVQNFSYKVTDGNLTIADLQYTPWSIADSPFEGQVVTVTGIVTNDTSANNRYEAYSIQDAEDPWSGIFVFGIGADLNRGDEITVTGTVTDYNPDWDFKWNSNTVILEESFSSVSSGNSINPIQVTTGELSMGAEMAEAHEAVLVEINDVILTNVNRYDVSFDDESGECLVDGDFMLDADQDPNSTFYVNELDGYMVVNGDTLYPGAIVDMIRGIFTYSFGTYKISLRNMEDFGNLVGIDKDFQAKPLSYNLGQNYPNPFNPTTNIYFEIPNAEPVKIVVYNVLGQKMRTLINAPYNPGRHVVHWDGRNDAGEQLSTGIYIYRIKAGDYIDARKMMLVK